MFNQLVLLVLIFPLSRVLNSEVTSCDMFNQLVLSVLIFPLSRVFILPFLVSQLHHHSIVANLTFLMSFSVSLVSLSVSLIQLLHFEAGLFLSTNGWSTAQEMLLSGLSRLIFGHIDLTKRLFVHEMLFISFEVFLDFDKSFVSLIDTGYKYAFTLVSKSLQKESSLP